MRQYLDYISKAVVADENFFGTVLRNTRFCNKHHNWNFLHLMFDQWENEQNLELRDQRKCMMPDPNHCGRSPTTLGLDYLDVLELSGDLFARKFVDSYDSRVKDAIDEKRKKEETELASATYTQTNNSLAVQNSVEESMSFEGHGTLIVAAETVNTSQPLCLGLGESHNMARLVPCFQDWVLSTLVIGWETGAVILEEVKNHTRWSMGPCSSNGNLERLDSGEISVIPGPYMPTGPKCNIKMMDGIRSGRCIDGESLDNQPGGPLHVYPCTKRWNQLLSFGNGVDAPAGSIHTVVPLYTQKRINATGREQEPYMCLGIARRGDLDEEDWFGEREDFFESYEDLDEDIGNIEDNRDYPPLLYWLGKQIMATRCSNKGAVIKWILVPFIVEEEPNIDEYNSTYAESEAIMQPEDEEL